MIVGNNFKIFFILIFFSISSFLHAEQKITTSPLVNIEKIKPSFEDLQEEKENISSSDIKEKRKTLNNVNAPHAELIGLDKITAKSTKLIVYFNKLKRFGPLEIKILQCGKVKKHNNT